MTGLRGRRNLKILNLENFFQDGLVTFKSGKYLHSLNNIYQLKELHMNFTYLGDVPIKILTRTCASSLRVLSIKVNKKDPHPEQIDPTAWRGLKRACPRLQVHADFDCEAGHVIIKTVLCQAIPVARVKIRTGPHSLNEIWDISETFRYLANNFSDTVGEYFQME